MINSDSILSNPRSTLLLHLETDVATLLLDKLRHFDITFERASQIAKFILAHLPENISDDQVMKIIPSLDDEFVELAGIVHKYLLEFEQKNQPIIAQEVADLIKHKHFAQASHKARMYMDKFAIK